MQTRTSAALADVFNVANRPSPDPRYAKDRDSKNAAVQSFGFLSVKGGCGATTLACHVAAELGRHQRVLLVDLDLNAGIVGFTMKASKELSILDAVEGLDSDRCVASDCKVASGVDVLGSPSAPTSGEGAPANGIGRVLRVARLRYGWTLVDLGHGLSRSTMGILGALDEVCLVCTLDVPALHLAKRTIQALIDIGCEKHRIKLILNRCPPQMDVTHSELEQLLGLPVFHTILNDYPALYEAYAEARLLAPDCELAHQIGGLASKLANSGR